MVAGLILLFRLIIYKEAKQDQHTIKNILMTVTSNSKYHSHLIIILMLKIKNADRQLLTATILYLRFSVTAYIVISELDRQIRQINAVDHSVNSTTTLQGNRVKQQFALGGLRIRI